MHLSNVVSISATNWVPLSAGYEYDSNIQVPATIKTWDDGYNAYIQPIVSEGLDFSINKDSIMYLPSAKALLDFIQDTSINIDVGAFVYFSISAGVGFNPLDLQYVSSSGTNLVLCSAINNDCFFRVAYNTDSTYSIIQKENLYVTVDETLPYNLTLQEKMTNSEDLLRQKFTFFTSDNNLYISTKIKNNESTTPTYIERFVSYSRASGSRGLLRAIGMIDSHNYLFNVYGFAVQMGLSGLQKGHDWIRYYNLYEDQTHNKDVEIYKEKSISDIKVNHLISIPYNTKIDISNNRMQMNIANLKNIYTDKYNTSIRPLDEVVNRSLSGVYTENEYLPVDKSIQGLSVDEDVSA